MKSELERATNHLNIGKGRCNGWIEQPEEIKSGIYCWTNKVNGKKYIGKATDLRLRRTQFLNPHNSYGGGKIKNARNRYGVENWDYEILIFCSNTQLDQWEIEFIKQFDTFKNGYNMTLGGGGMYGFHLSEQTKQILSDKTKERFKDKANHPLYGKRHSKAARKKMSEWQIGRKLPETTRQRMSEARTGEKNPRYGVEVKPETKEKIKESLSKYWYYQLTLDGELIKVWGSATEAAKELNTYKQHIYDCIKGKAKTCAGFRWERVKR